MLKVLIVDNRTLTRHAMCSLLSSLKLDVVGDVSNFEEVYSIAIKKAPNIIMHFGSNTPEKLLLFVNKNHVKLTKTRYAYIGNNVTYDDISLGTKIGIYGWISESVTPNNLVYMLPFINEGCLIIFPDIGVTFKHLKISDSSPNQKHLKTEDLNHCDDILSGIGLTNREIEVITLLTEGASNKAISDILHISENTVKTHVRNILEKLQLRSRVSAAIYALNLLKKE